MQDIEWHQFVTWAFMGIVSGGVGWTTLFLSRISRSISALNQQLGVIVERTDWHQKELNNHTERLASLEGRLSRK